MHFAVCCHVAVRKTILQHALKLVKPSVQMRSKAAFGYLDLRVQLIARHGCII
jgi:hypothetical protein